MILGRDCTDEGQTQAVGGELARSLPRDHAFRVHLRGDLGAGKTTLVRGFLRELGHLGAVKSPTYGLVERYQVGSLAVCHFDLYRLADPEELEFLGWRDLVEDTAVAFFEWPERGGALLGEPDLVVEITPTEAGRHIVLSADSAAGEAWLSELDAQRVVENQ